MAFHEEEGTPVSHLLAGAVASLALANGGHMQHQVRPKVLPQCRRRMKCHLNSIERWSSSRISGG